ncbi:polysaccharide ABC transporter ATP-binding protein [Chryseobacterium taklimakanense]|uniref:ABC transporter ATP-binding protein n=1 Tax=Chryseobacterium taklimakanense TaxID=536441 RepID=UPI001EF42154|nr:polysaccharide ABC transporter ATP-binding protein [Chryseobacterium taklimakanense]MCG7281483.1 polysaccharide ABC transporter ATP-binding protein [Chryseobacterium taklimakanense]
MLALKAENISKQYRLGQVGTGTLSHDLNRFWHQIRGKEDPYLKIGEANDRATKGESEYVWSLRDINFEVEQGDAVGIIGRNGAGKSTLLKLLSKVTKPTTGKIYTNGRIASLLEVGTGFHPEMTGRENVYLNGAILGMTRKEITRKFDEIVDFSGVERYIDTPVKRYSSGMYVRLAFAVAAHLESEILIVDEVLAVGDAEFQKKCLGKMGDVSKGEGRTVLFVSHDLNAVSQICQTGILLNQGLVEYNGAIRETVSTYLNSNNDSVIYLNQKDNSAKSMFIREIQVVKNNGEVSKEYLYNEPINFKFTIGINEKIRDTSFFVTILDSRKRRVFSCERDFVDETMTLSIEPNTLVRGSYSIHAFINQPKVAQLDVAEDVCKFTVIDPGSYLSKHGEYDYGSVFGRYMWD